MQKSFNWLCPVGPEPPAGGVLSGSVEWQALGQPGAVDPESSQLGACWEQNGNFQGASRQNESFHGTVPASLAVVFVSWLTTVPLSPISFPSLTHPCCNLSDVPCLLSQTSPSLLVFINPLPVIVPAMSDCLQNLASQAF